VFRNPLIIVANEQAPYKSLKDVVDAAKKEPGKLNWGYPGAGTTQHLTGELFKQVAAVDIQGVMYKGSAQVGAGPARRPDPALGRRHRPNLPHIKAASCAPSPRPAPRARRSCPTCRPWPSSAIPASRARAGAASSS
jgi:hypothetical protein